MSSEIDTLHVPFRKWLDDAGICYTYHRPDKATGSTPGDADFMIHRNGRCLMIEFKDKNTETSDSQIERHAELLKHGCEVFIQRALETARTLVVQWLSAMDLPVDLTVKKGASDLCILSGSVFRRDGRGGWSRLRSATLSDANLPQMHEVK